MAEATVTPSHHSWTPWERVGAIYDYAGGYIGPTYQRLSGAARPVTAGWSRRCRLCGETEQS